MGGDGCGGFRGTGPPRDMKGNCNAMEKAYGLSRSEWSMRVLASVWSRLLARINDDTTDEEFRALQDAMELIHCTQLEVLGEREREKAAWRDVVRRVR